MLTIVIYIFVLLHVKVNAVEINKCLRGLGHWSVAAFESSRVETQSINAHFLCIFCTFSYFFIFFFTSAWDVYKRQTYLKSGKSFFRTLCNRKCQTSHFTVWKENEGCETERVPQLDWGLQV